MYTEFLVLGFLTSCVQASNESSLVSKFYEDTQVHEFACSVEFSRSMNFDCVCIEGLWLFYDSCNETFAISGKNGHCEELSGTPVSKAVQLAKSSEDLVVLSSDGLVIRLLPENAKGANVDSDAALITGSDWTLVEASGVRICLTVTEADSYCHFFNRDDTEWVLDALEKGCEYFDYSVEPEKCIPIGKSNNDTICEDRVEHRQLYNRDKRALGDDETGSAPAAAPDAGATVPDNAPAAAPESLPATKPDAAAESASKVPPAVTPTKPALKAPAGIGNASPQGRVFFGAPGQVRENVSSLVGNGTLWKAEDSEDFFNATAPGAENKTLELDAIATEIWNYVDGKLDKLLGFERKPSMQPELKPDGLNVTYSNPMYEFLEVAKRILLKTCPPYYATPEFIEMAVAAFIRIQKVHFKFTETTFKPSSFRRVLEALRRCENKVKKFNFTEGGCDGKVGGNFSAFETIVELAVSEDWVPRDRDPIVETVWKVFFNAHSACFPYFDGAYNDHHRFTTWMMPLFQNQMHDLWLHGKTSKNSLNGLFGNQVEVQANIAYCAASTRLESKYPWDLPRPNRVLKFGKPVNFTMGGKARKRRDIDLYVSDTTLTSGGRCLDHTKPLICPTHVQFLTEKQSL